MKKILLITSVILFNSLKSQTIIASQDFEGPLTYSLWPGIGAIEGQGAITPYEGFSMYALDYYDHISSNINLPSVPKFIGFWSNAQFANHKIDVKLFNSSNTQILIIGTYTVVQNNWTYKEFPLGAGYTGQHRVSFQAVGGSNTAKTYLDLITIKTGVTTNLDETISNNDIFFYPNPSSNNKIGIAFKNKIENISMQFYDSTGKLVLEEKASVSTNENKEIDVTQLSNGIYTCKISDSKGYVTKKIIINK